MPRKNIQKLRAAEKRERKRIESEKQRIRCLIEKKASRCCKCGKIYCDCAVLDDMKARGWKIIKKEGNYWVLDGFDGTLFPIPFGNKDDAWKFALDQYKNPK